MPSSVVQNFSYNADTKTLMVIFVSGAVYEYYHVPHAAYMDMKMSGSKGTYLNLHIKDKYGFKKIA